MYVKIILSLLIIAHAKADDVVLPYNEVAYTTSGAPCIGGCSPETHQCVASWPPKNEPCVRHPTPAPKFLTTQAITKHKYCLSNCGYYDWQTAWCFVTSDGQWDNCTPQEQQVIANDFVLPYTMIAYTTTGNPCIGGCSPDTHQCVASWPPKNQPCVLYNVPAPTYHTTQKYTNYRNCLSNCGPFSWNTPWCYVTSDGQWDYCNSQEQLQQQQQQQQQHQQQQQATAPLNSNDGILPYYEVAYTTSGSPCIGGCSPETHQCVASWPPKNEPCVSHNTLAPRFCTTQSYTKYKYCLSNCGTFLGWNEPWCYVTSDGQWDACTPVQNQHLTTQQVTTPKPFNFDLNFGNLQQQHAPRPTGTSPKPFAFDLNFGW